MSERRTEHIKSPHEDDGKVPSFPSDPSKHVFGVFWAILLLGSILVAGPWSGFHGILFGCVGLLMALRPPAVALPRLWWILALCFLLASTSSFLPAHWFGIPAWRRGLELLGIQTGWHVVIQSRHAAESLAMFAVILFTGLWLAGHRPSSSQLRLWALAFTLGVASYAILAKLSQASNAAGTGDTYGFFPNRNHTATYLAMGAVCGLGNILQALRERRFFSMCIALAATGVCLWAVGAWSVSRAGILLVAAGTLAWLLMLGTRYLGRNGLRVISLLALAVVGGFLIADTHVKERLSDTVEKAGSVISATPDGIADDGKPNVESSRGLDFRIPTMLDTLAMVRDSPWTGVGAGQYYYIFPQYRKLTAVANEADNYHPESDWLWMASETGLPATLALATLVLLACWKSLTSILHGRDRALRGACLVAAMLVPFHGIFDVPGHRITLAWSAALLFALSLRQPGNGNDKAAHLAPQPPRSPSAWPFRLAALFLLAACAFLIRAQWFGGPQPALVAGDLACNDALALYKVDQERQNAALEAGHDYTPAEHDDPLEQALVPLDKASLLLPLHRRIHFLKGYIRLHFADEQTQVRESFQVARALDPTWVAGPLQQALAWSNQDPQETISLWEEALKRARWLDQHNPGSPYSESTTLQRIRQQTHGKPDLEQLWKSHYKP